MLLAGFFIYKQTSAPSQTDKSKDKNTGKQAETEKSKSGGQTLEGTLKTSDNLKKGNLMISTGKRTIYLFTSRDFSSLLDKNVTVTYNGTLDNFTLDNIVAK